MRPAALIVDDDPFMHKWLARALYHIGIDTYEAENNTQAMSLVQAHPLQLITTDMYRPGGTGLDLIRRVRALPDLRSVPIILISGGASLVDCQHAKEAGAAAMLRKPVEYEELYAVIQQIRVQE